jgi:hypothetical protein
MRSSFQLHHAATTSIILHHTGMDRSLTNKTVRPIDGRRRLRSWTANDQRFVIKGLVSNSMRPKQNERLAACRAAEGECGGTERPAIISVKAAPITRRPASISHILPIFSIEVKFPTNSSLRRKWAAACRNPQYCQTSRNGARPGTKT